MSDARAVAKSILKGLLKGAAGTLVAFVIVEALLRVVYVVRNAAVEYVPLPYVIGHKYGPTPPWLDGLRVLESDADLLWRNRRNVRRKYLDIFSPVQREEERSALLRQFLPVIPASLKGNPVWEISLNSEGFRDVEFPRTKPSSVFRIVCLGDSWTFGANVGQDQAYPQRLRARLRREFPGRDFEVFNLGVLGYSSYQGLTLLKLRAIQLEPDVIIIGFAMNDASVDGYRDKDLGKSGPKPFRFDKWLSGLTKNLESYKLVRYLALVVKWQPRSLGDGLTKPAAPLRAKNPEEKVNYDELEQWTRVSPRDYEQNIREMIRLVRQRGGRAILLFNEHWRTSPYRDVLDEVSRAEGVPFVNSAELIAAARKKIEADLEARLDLRAPPAGRAPAAETVDVVFRVYTGDRPVPRAMYIAGNHPALGSGVPNMVRMYDDGTHEDQRKGDQVWSLAARLPRGIQLAYVYTNSGREGRWEGLDVPEIRGLEVEAPNGEERVYRPVGTFGRIYMNADSWHTDASGYELIVDRILESLRKDPTFRRHLVAGP